MIKVHHLKSSRSQRVLWMLEELELPYELVTYERDPETLLAPASLQEIHPLGKSPVLDDGDVRIAESGAILEYLAETHGKGRFVPAAGTPAHSHYRYFMHYAEGSLMPFLVMKIVFRRIETARLPFFVRPIAKKIAAKVNADFLDPNLTRHVKFLAQHLEQHTWFTGDELTTADVQMSYPMEGLLERARHLGLPPSIESWVARVRERPAYQRALDKAGPAYGR